MESDISIKFELIYLFYFSESWWHTDLPQIGAPLVQTLACCFGAKPLAAPMMTYYQCAPLRMYFSEIRMKKMFRYRCVEENSLKLLFVIHEHCYSLGIVVINFRADIVCDYKVMYEN